MITFKCPSCSFTFSEADKVWDKAIANGSCPSCGVAHSKLNLKGGLSGEGNEIKDNIDKLESDVSLKPTGQNNGLYEKFIKGNFGLAITYWVFGVAVSIIFNLAYRTVSSDTTAYAIAATFAIYQFALLAAIWNAAKKYSGSKIWAILAVLIVIIGVLRNVGTLLS